MDIRDRYKNYTKNHCWQYDVRKNNLSSDLETSPFTREQIIWLTTDDFYLEPVDKKDESQCREVKSFIERHEWLGNLPNRPTHRYAARSKKGDALAGVLIFSVPNAFSCLLGKDFKNKEKLLSRGACISWSPKNLASWMISAAIKDLVKNTEFRFFTAYSDPEAKELGSIYQGLNWIYLGKQSGTAGMYRDVTNYFGLDKYNKGWFSDRHFRHKTVVKKICRMLRERGEIDFDVDDKKWWKSYTLKWDIVPEDIAARIKNEQKKFQESCECRIVPKKHKYAFILGEDKRETRALRKKFVELNPKICTDGKPGLPYPKVRGE